MMLFEVPLYVRCFSIKSLSLEPAKTLIALLWRLVIIILISSKHRIKKKQVFINRAPQGKPKKYLKDPNQINQKYFTNHLRRIYNSLLIKLLRQAQMKINFLWYLFVQIEETSSCEQVLLGSKFFGMLKFFFDPSVG
jgi:hypothetical protein